jgi:hypothetical protein
MAIPIPTPLIEFILLGPQDDRRQLQDSPILGDVWVAFGKDPHARVDLLISPYRGLHAGSVAARIDDEIGKYYKSIKKIDQANIAFLQGLIVACLTFEEVMRFVVPKTNWWISKKLKEDEALHEVRKYGDAITVLKEILDSAEDWRAKTGKLRLQELPVIKRFLALTALILWAGSFESNGEKLDSERQIDYVLEEADKNLNDLANRVNNLADQMLKDPTEQRLIWQVSLNRAAMPAISKSVQAVKADAATTLFKVNCSEIGWAVIDSGIDARHPAFLDKDGNCRVKRSFDFKNFRKIVNLGNSRDGIRKINLQELMKEKNNLLYSFKTLEADGVDEADEALKRLADDARNQAPVHWELVQKFVEIKPTTTPPTNHGTHVAGIIGASKEGVQNFLKEGSGKDNSAFADGMCPDISLYDFRVLGPSIKDAEFAIIAALQFIRYLNSQDSFLDIHGANLSLSIPHDVRNFACGRTPICDECEQLISSGVVVVAAAGNHGYKSFETKEGLYDSYAAFSITDPGNADGVITVGATHRFWPHTYGVSFFSSRGPTGDGRMKPDLVAPGERIHAPLSGENCQLGGEWGELDGTSMAAPHVSGAAAMLMARYSEMIGQPRRIKQILCENATDLGRERSFQGHGMLDVLRAFQSI